MLYRSATGFCPINKQLDRDTTDPQAISISDDIIVNAPKDKVYAFWRELSNLPKFMIHLKSVEEISDGISLWTAHTPGGLIDLKWKSEITRDDIYIYIEIDYFPPAGSVGRGITSMFNGIFERMIREDIQRFKTYAEETDFKQYAGLAF